MISISQQTWLQPWIKLARGERPLEQLRALAKTLLVPLAGIAAFLLLWAVAAGQINTSLGAFPGPLDVWQQGGALLEEHAAERR
ncbi:MAG TPA: nitrate ABC transporter permease, partial [Alcanivorax sp.]|nr:nitrate ABC transporter permease [Alcanivorax sp.]